MARKYFPFYFSLYETAQMMSPKMRTAFYQAVIDYGVTGQCQELPKAIAGYWPVVQPMLDTARKHYETGEKGGRPPKKEPFGLNEAKTVGSSNNETPLSSAAETKKEKEKEKKKEKKKEKEWEVLL